MVLGDKGYYMFQNRADQSLYYSWEARAPGKKKLLTVLQVFADDVGSRPSWIHFGAHEYLITAQTNFPVTLKD